MFTFKSAREQSKHLLWVTLVCFFLLWWIKRSAVRKKWFSHLQMLALTKLTWQMTCMHMQMHTRLVLETYYNRRKNSTHSSRMSTTSVRLSKTSLRVTMFGCWTTWRISTSCSTLLLSKPRWLHAFFRIFRNLPAQQVPVTRSRTCRTWPKCPLEWARTYSNSQ